MTAFGLFLLAFGAALIYATIQGQSIGAEFRSVFTRQSAAAQ